MTTSHGDPMLSAAWVNARIEHVFTRAMNIMMKLIDDATYSGYLPFESPPDKDYLKRISPEDRKNIGLNFDEELDMPPGLVPPDFVESLLPAPQPLANEQTIL